MERHRRRRKRRVIGRWVATKGEKWIFVICMFVAITTGVFWLARSAYPNKSSQEIPDAGIPDDYLVRAIESAGKPDVTTKPENENRAKDR